MSFVSRYQGVADSGLSDFFASRGFDSVKFKIDQPRMIVWMKENSAAADEIIICVQQTFLSLLRHYMIETGQMACNKGFKLSLCRLGPKCTRQRCDFAHDWFVSIALKLLQQPKAFTTPCNLRNCSGPDKCYHAHEGGLYRTWDLEAGRYQLDIYESDQYDFDIKGVVKFLETDEKEDD